ncbi:MAG: M23 family metallopeptidase [Anaerolineaceae bacterium]|nr:M23 family metallopeptidase [Anaerolineaceae bacterium]
MNVQLQNWPVYQPFTITQLFGENPQEYLVYGYPGHNGLDVISPMDDILAAAPGTVVIASMDQTGYGNLVKLDHGGWYSYYAHLSRIDVSTGQAISPGQRVGSMGWTGNVRDANGQRTPAATHLHFEIRIPGTGAPGFKSGAVDPLPYLQLIGNSAAAQALTAAQPAALPAEDEPAGRQAMVITEYVNARTEPSTVSVETVVGHLPELLVLQVIKTRKIGSDVWACLDAGERLWCAFCVSGIQYLKWC